jgi:leucyl/phenylalanyl-tRNA---protein transferase
MDITPDILLQAYAMGLFPMAESRDADAMHWYDPDPRGILPLDAVHVPRSLQKTLRKNPYRISFNENFSGVIHGCADRDSTWINDDIIALYTALHERGFAHSAEAWLDGALVGGVYGVSIGGAFCGESMFSRAANASKTALVRLAEHLKARGFALFDTQFTNDHIAQFGVIEIPRAEYHARLAKAITMNVKF